MRARSRVRALAGLLLVMVLVLLDQTALIPALPEVAGDLGGGGLMIGAQATLGEIISGRERGWYLGLFGVAYILPAVIGLTVAPLLVVSVAPALLLLR